MDEGDGGWWLVVGGGLACGMWQVKRKSKCNLFAAQRGDQSRLTACGHGRCDSRAATTLGETLSRLSKAKAITIKTEHKYLICNANSPYL